MTQMKKLYLVLIFFVFAGIFVFGDNDILEEEPLLFLPDSGNQFANSEQAFIQLDNLALFLSNKNPVPGQIVVYGYAAYVPNDINSVDLSKERALFVMNELQKRGISKELFAEPVSCGSVYLWGDNANEKNRELNRRVRVLLLDGSSMPVIRENVYAEMKTVIPGIVYEKPAAFKFPWWILPLLALFLLLFLFLLGKRTRKPAHKEGAANAQPQITETEIVPEFTPKAAVTTSTVNLDEEIRSRAYELSRQHNDLGEYQEQDWHDAVREISALYTACGHSVFNDGGCWWASRSYSYDFPAASFI
jgi:hypothetical protein